MTEFPSPLTDEEISAAIDGEAEPSVQRRLQDDPVAAARARSLSAARDIVSTTPVPSLDAPTIDTLVNTALERADDPTAVDDSAVSTPTPLSPRATRVRNLPPNWAVAAVVAVLVAIGVGLVWSGRDDDNGTTVAAAPTTSESVVLGSTGGSKPADTSSAPASIIYVGRFDTNAALRTFLADSIPTKGRLAGPTLAPTTQSVIRCANQIATIMGAQGIGTAPDRQALAKVGDQTLLVYEFDLLKPTPKASSLISAVDPTACNPAFTFLR
ncbi:MAG: hypothetical protein KDB02_13305 [Acidimicrobiales bacterium]|nr:hypothetical protein [Acidimicrobiales bacterium]MCB1246480.1 hypothetical protein [Acidimicrobiia bacterium]